MPEFAQYDVWLTDHEGNVLTSLMGGGFEFLVWQHLINDVGVYELRLVTATGLPARFAVDYGVKVERDYGDGMYLEYWGLHLDAEEEARQGQGVDEQYWSSIGLSPEWLLDQPLLQPLPNPNPNWPRYDTWSEHGAADDVMKDMVSESMGLEAGVDRQFGNFSVQGKSSEGAWDCYEGKWVRLLEAVQAIAGDRGLCDFRVVPVAGGYEFQTYAPFYGTDRRVGYADPVTGPTIFSLERQNVSYARRRTIRRQEATVAYGAWQGVGEDQDILGPAINAGALGDSPFRRREILVDVNDVPQESAVLSVLEQALVDEGELVEVEFTALQQDDCLYGRDWAIGDLVTFVWTDGTEYAMRFMEVNGRIDGRNEETIVGRAELWTRAEEAS